MGEPGHSGVDLTDCANNTLPMEPVLPFFGTNSGSPGELLVVLLLFIVATILSGVVGLRWLNAFKQAPEEYREGRNTSPDTSEEQNR